MEPQKIHPFDFFILLRDNPELKPEDTGETADITVCPVNHDSYVVTEPVIKLGQQTYIQTSTVTPITKELY
jgi:hypothetical protein